MRLIYEPRGPAREYSELACNLFGDAEGKHGGCSHGCLYCYCPDVLRIPPARFHCRPLPRPNVLADLERDAARMAQAGDRRRVLFSFIGDPYCPEEAETETSRRALEIMVAHGLNFDVLTKGGARAIRDFDLLEAGRASFGTSLAWTEDFSRRIWEPYAATIEERWMAITHARARGLRTWLSMEPVLDAEQALELLAWIEVDEVRIGRASHLLSSVTTIDWQAFTDAAYDLCLANAGGADTLVCGRAFLFKQSLAPYLRGRPPSGGADTLVCGPDLADRNVCPTKAREAPGVRPYAP